MGFEAVVAEAEGKQICGTAEGGVGAASVGGGDENAAFGGCLFQDFFEFPCFNQRDVGGNHQGEAGAALHADAGGDLDGAGLSGIVGVGDDFECILAG